MFYNPENKACRQALFRQPAGTLSVLLRQYRSTSLAVLQYFHGSTAVLPKKDYSAFNTTSAPFKRGEVSFTRISPFSPVVWI